MQDTVEGKLSDVIRRALAQPRTAETIRELARCLGSAMDQITNEECERRHQSPPVPEPPDEWPTVTQAIYDRLAAWLLNELDRCSRGEVDIALSVDVGPKNAVVRLAHRDGDWTLGYGGETQ